MSLKKNTNCKNFMLQLITFNRKKNFNKILKIKYVILFLVSTLIVSSLGFSPDSFAQTPEGLPSQIHAPDRLIVKFNPGVPESQQNSILSAQNSVVLDHLQLLDVKIISVPEQALDAVKNALSKNKSVQYAEYDVAVPPTTVPNDGSYGNQWYLPMINAPEAYDITLVTVR